MTNSIKAILSKAKESLKAAELLYKEGYFAFAASRAYYSMFYIAEALLFSIGQSYSRHSGVISNFGKEFTKTNKMHIKYHRRLIDAQDTRNIGDYGIEVNISKEQSEEMINWASEFIQAGEEYLAKKGKDV